MVKITQTDFSIVYVAILNELQKQELYKNSSKLALSLTFAIFKAQAYPDIPRYETPDLSGYEDYRDESQE